MNVLTSMDLLSVQEGLCLGKRKDYYRLVNDFNGNEDVWVADYATTIMPLRGEMLTANEGINGYGKGFEYGYNTR